MVVVVVVPVWVIKQCMLIIGPAAAPRIGGLTIAQAHTFQSNDDAAACQRSAMSMCMETGMRVYS